MLYAWEPSKSINIYQYLSKAYMAMAQKQIDKQWICINYMGLCVYTVFSTIFGWKKIDQSKLKMCLQLHIQSLPRPIWSDWCELNMIGLKWWN